MLFINETEYKKICQSFSMCIKINTDDRGCHFRLTTR